MGRGTSPSRGMEGDALSSAIFRLHEQLIPLSYLSSISGIINHFDDLHFTSPFTNILTLWVRGGMCCAMLWCYRIGKTAKLRYYSMLLVQGAEQGDQPRWRWWWRSGCINFQFISIPFLTQLNSPPKCSVCICTWPSYWNSQNLACKYLGGRRARKDSLLPWKPIQEVSWDNIIIKLCVGRKCNVEDKFTVLIKTYFSPLFLFLQRACGTTSANSAKSQR